MAEATVDIPVIDISSKNAKSPSQLLDAATKYGFVFIENNQAGIPSRDIKHMFELSHQFFATPMDVKYEVAISSNKAGKNHGWLSRGIEKLDPATQKRADVKEAFNIGEHVNRDLQQRMPRSLQPHIQAIMDFQDSCHELCNRIFERFAEALDIERDWFTSRHDQSKGPSGTVLRMLYYPHVKDVEDGVDIRAGAHSDFGSVTILFQLPGQPGLEIQTPSGDWAQVPVAPHNETNGTTNDAKESPNLPILVNFGDLLEDWTGGLIKSTMHRVIFPEGERKDRYSIAYFCHPLDDAELEPVPSRLIQAQAATTVRERMKNGNVLTAKGHLMERLGATYSIK